MIYLKLFLTFFKIGLFTFGGGYAMLPMIQQELENNMWVTYEDLANFIAVSESTPGPFAVNIATFIGMQTGGLLGAVCSTGGVVLPSFLIILLVARLYDKFKNSRIVAGCMTGLKPAVVGLIGAALLNLASTIYFPYGFDVSVMYTPTFYISLGIFALCTLFVEKLHPILLICLSGVIGIIAGYLVELPY